jgi:hypothetical protein
MKFVITKDDDDIRNYRFIKLVCGKLSVLYQTLYVQTPLKDAGSSNAWYYSKWEFAAISEQVGPLTIIWKGAYNLVGLGDCVSCVSSQRVAKAVDRNGQHAKDHTTLTLKLTRKST